MTTKGDRLRALRENASLTLEEVAERLSITRQAIYKYEKNIVTNIPSDKIEALAKLYDSTPEYIMGWDPVDFIVEFDDDVKALIKLKSTLSPKSWKRLKLYAEFLKKEDRLEEESKND